jgi:VIT1/CCC1 family predicted Fe2+/Mn2+ transporter
VAIDHHLGAEHHRSHRVGWLRAAVLGANDGIVSTASLLIGVAAAGASHTTIVTAAFAALVAGAMSMATGEFVSVSSQRDTEMADRRIEADALERSPMGELHELAKIYEDRGVEPGLARLVAEQLMAKDALSAHMRDELGVTDESTARPVQAALTSAAAFTAGALLPLVTALVSPRGVRIGTIAVVALLALLGLGALGAQAGGASRTRAALRVVLWSAAAMLVTYVIGRIVGANV